MQRTFSIFSIWMTGWVPTLIGFGLAVSGCTQFRHQLADMLTADLDYQAYRDAVDGSMPAGTYDEAYQIQQATQDYANQLTEAMQQQEAAKSQVLSRREDVPQVRWVDLSPAQAAVPTKSTLRTAGSQQSTDRSQDKPLPISTQIMFESPPAPAVVQQPSQGRSALLDQLLDHIRSGEGQPMDKALTAAALSLVEPGRALEAADFFSLQPTKQKSVRRYHQLVVSLAQELAARDGELDADTIADHINSIFGERPISISKIQLCRSVRGYGVYEPFESSVFLAGREHAMIVYVELDHFRVNQDEANQRYQVRLSQELVLYKESDGLAVWQQPKVNIVDDSRNLRRDFFVVQMIRIPARLGVGKYVLKVRMTDLNSNSLDELTIPIQLVADKALVGGRLK